MNTEGFAAFGAKARAAGYDEVLERRWAPTAVAPAHTHPFDVSAVVVAGEMWCPIGTDTRHLRPGDHFTLARKVVQGEATVLRARRN